MQFKSVALLALFATSSAFAAPEAKVAELNKEAAEKIAAKAFACGAKNGWKLSVAIVNAEGNLVLFQRGDGSYSGSIDASMEKAKSANAFQRPTSAFTQSIKDGRTGLLSMKGIVAVEGGVPLAIDGKHVGAIGISGARATEDEQCANEAAGVKPKS